MWCGACSPISKRISSYHAELGQRVENKASRVDFLYFIEQGCRSFGQLYVGRLEDGILLIKSNLGFDFCKVND